MAVFVSEMFDQLRDLLNDPTDTQVTYATKKLFLNIGIRRMYPKVFRYVWDSTLVLVSNTFEYTVPGSLQGLGGVIVAVEVETGNATNQYFRFSHYDLIPGDEDLASKLIITTPILPSAVGARIRIRAAVPCSLIVAADYAAAQSEAWVGPDLLVHLPVYYAMAMTAGRKLDDRQDTLRYSTTQAMNGVDDQDIMQASQLWLGQYELELDAAERPLPIAKD